MTLTLNQVLYLVLTFAAVMVVVWLVLLLAQLRKTAKEGQRTMAEVRVLAKHLQNTSLKVHDQLEGVDEMLQATKKTANILSEIALFTVTRVVRPSSKYWPLLFPVARLGWWAIKKKRKEEDNNVK